MQSSRGSWIRGFICFMTESRKDFGMEPRSCMMERVLDVLELPESCLDDTWKDLIYLIVAYRNSGDAALQDKAREAVWLLSDIVDNHRRYPFFTKEKIDMKIESIQQCEDSFPAQLRKKVAMQDAYLNLRPKDLIACLGMRMPKAGGFWRRAHGREQSATKSVTSMRSRLVVVSMTSQELNIASTSMRC